MTDGWKVRPFNCLGDYIYAISDREVKESAAPPGTVAPAQRCYQKIQDWE